MLLKNLFHHVEILIMHPARDLARRDLGDESAAGTAVHIGVYHPNPGQQPLSSKIANSNLLQRLWSLQLTISPSVLN
jgi:hypothetical protein